MLDEERLRSLKRSARKHAESKYSLQKILPQYEAYYRKILGKDSRGLAAGE